MLKFCKELTTNYQYHCYTSYTCQLNHKVNNVLTESGKRSNLLYIKRQWIPKFYTRKTKRTKTVLWGLDLVYKHCQVFIIWLTCIIWMNRGYLLSWSNQQNKMELIYETTDKQKNFNMDYITKFWKIWGFEQRFWMC